MDLESARKFASCLHAIQETIEIHEPQLSEQESLAPRERFDAIAERLAALPSIKVELDLYGTKEMSVKEVFQEDQTFPEIQLEIIALYDSSRGSVTRHLYQIIALWSTTGDPFAGELVRKWELGESESTTDADVMRRLGLIEESVIAVESLYSPLPTAS